MVRQKKWIDEELEHLRSILYKYVDGRPSRLSSPNTLMASMLLDNHIVEVQKGKQDTVVP